MKRQHELIMRNPLFSMVDLIEICRTNPVYSAQPTMETVFRLLMDHQYKDHAFARIPYFDVQLYVLRQECYGLLYQRLIDTGLISNEKALDVAKALVNSELSSRLTLFFEKIVKNDIPVEIEYGYCEDDWSTTIVEIINDVLDVFHRKNLRGIFWHLVYITNETGLDDWKIYGMTVVDSKDGWGPLSIDPTHVSFRNIKTGTFVGTDRIDAGYTIDFYADNGKWMFDGSCALADFINHQGKIELSEKVEDRIREAIYKTLVTYIVSYRETSANILIQYGNMIELTDDLVEQYRTSVISMGIDSVADRLDLKNMLSRELEKKLQEVLHNLEKQFDVHIFFQDMDSWVC